MNRSEYSANLALTEARATGNGIRNVSAATVAQARAIRAHDRKMKRRALVAGACRTVYVLGTVSAMVAYFIAATA